MMMMENNKIIKVYCLIIGSYSVGKTTLLNRLNNNVLSLNQDYQMTTRINIFRKTYVGGIGQTESSNNKRIEIVYLEFPGKQLYQNLLFEFIKKVQQQQYPIFIVGMFDVSNRQSINHLEQLFNSINKIMNANTQINSGNINKAPQELSNRIMIANKIDLVDKRIISNQEGQSKSKMLKCTRYLECTAQNDLTMQEFEQSILSLIK